MFLDEFVMPTIYMFSIEIIFYRRYFQEYPIRKESHTPRNLANKLQFQKNNLGIRAIALQNTVLPKNNDDQLMVCKKRTSEGPE